jgi:hypothetical protein
VPSSLLDVKETIEIEGFLHFLVELHFRNFVIQFFGGLLAIFGQLLDENESLRDNFQRSFVVEAKLVLDLGTFVDLLHGLETGLLPFLELAPALLEFDDRSKGMEIMLNLNADGLGILEGSFLGLEQQVSVGFILLVDIVEDLSLLQLNCFLELLVDLETVVPHQCFLLAVDLAEDIALLGDLLLEVVQPLDAVVAVLAEQCAVRTDLLLVRDADDVHRHLVQGTQLLDRALFWGRRGRRREIDEELIFLLLGWGLARRRSLRQREEEGRIEGEDSDFCPLEEVGAEAADEYFLLGVDDFPETGFADAVGTGGQLPRQLHHREVVEALAAFLY